MSRSKKVLLVFGACAATIIVGWVLIIGAVYASGVVSVRIQEDGGPNIYLPVPAALVNAAAFTGGMALDTGSTFLGGHHDDLETQLEAHLGVDLEEWQPMLRAMLEVIEDCPDVTFVDVVDGSDHVKVVKEGRYLRVIVSDPSFNLNISLPTKTATRTVARLIG